MKDEIIRVKDTNEEDTEKIYVDEETDKKIENIVNELYERYRKIGDRQFLINDILIQQEEMDKYRPEEHPKVSEDYYDDVETPMLIASIICNMFSSDNALGYLSFPVYEKAYRVAYKLEEDYLKELEEHGKIGFRPD